MSSVAGRAALLLVVLLLLAGWGAPRPEASPPGLNVRYGLSLAGVPVAKLTLAHEVEGRRYRTVGLVERLTGYRSEMHASGRVGDDRGLVPGRYELASEARKKARTVEVRFDPSSGDVVDLQITKRGKPDRSKVPTELQKGVMDPLSAFLELRDWAGAARDVEGAPAPFEAAVFDGRKRTDMVARVLGRDHEVVAGRERAVVRVELGLRPLAGYDDDDLDEAGALDVFRLELLLSDDERLLPLRLTTLDWLLTASIDLLEDCSTRVGCRTAMLEW